VATKQVRPAQHSPGSISGAQGQLHSSLSAFDVERSRLEEYLDATPAQDLDDGIGNYRHPRAATVAGPRLDQRHATAEATKHLGRVVIVAAWRNKSATYQR